MSRRDLCELLCESRRDVSRCYNIAVCLVEIYDGYLDEILMCESSRDLMCISRRDLIEFGDS